MKQVKAKKHLGQHFLNDLSIARDIAESLSGENYDKVLEVGPGMGVMTKYLLEKDYETWVIEIDSESVVYLGKNFPQLDSRIIPGDFLKINIDDYLPGRFALIGNYPYNISSQILFKALELKDRIPEICGMFQKEVAERVVSPPGSKKYGIISVLLQAFYNAEYLFTVDEHVFTPPPKVKSGVIRLTRNDVTKLDCDEKLFKQVVKMGFNQRRKTLSNALKAMVPDPEIRKQDVFRKRAEQLSVEDFIQLTQLIASQP